jgi:hypothetical protein
MEGNRCYDLYLTDFVNNSNNFETHGGNGIIHVQNGNLVLEDISLEKVSNLDK